MVDQYSVVYKTPSPERFCELRKLSGLSPKTVETATLALPNTLFGVSIIDNTDGSIIGMGRIVGDGHLVLTIVDVAVLPEHQKKGLGKLIMKCLSDYIEANVKRDCYITLMADGDAKLLYQQYGFVSSLPKTLGMHYAHPAK
jgi:GNAT superfamily N-acetyltransferase